MTKKLLDCIVLLHYRIILQHNFNQVSATDLEEELKRAN
jgi:hypothetical protein